MNSSTNITKVKMSYIAKTQSNRDYISSIMQN
nr:MAG TPA_asm: hypothetical protein [Caudoviricetes sp.]